MAVLDDFVTRRWLIAIAILTFALQVFISQRISLFIPSGKIAHIVQSPDEIIRFKISDEIYSNEFSKVDNSENIFHSDKRYVFALIFCNSLLYLLILGRRLRWAQIVPVSLFPGVFTNSLEGLIFGGVVNWIHVQTSKFTLSLSLGDILVYSGLVFHLILTVRIGLLQYKFDTRKTSLVE